MCFGYLQQREMLTNKIQQESTIDNYYANQMDDHRVKRMSTGHVKAKANWLKHGKSNKSERKDTARHGRGEN